VTSSTIPARARGRGILIAAFVVYFALLTWVVLWKLEVPWIGEAALLPRPLKLVPFVASGDAGASAPVEVVINLVLFIPFGLFMGALAPLAASSTSPRQGMRFSRKASSCGRPSCSAW